jgi:hypothetical protein
MTIKDRESINEGINNRAGKRWVDVERVSRKMGWGKKRGRKRRR